MSRAGVEPVRTAILARAPIPGQAKTRLIPALGETGAATLQARLIERAVDTAAAVGPVTLWATPDAGHAGFVAAAARYGLELKRQPDGDLGTRILAAMTVPGGTTLVIGTDCPVLTSRNLQVCAELLRAGRDVVVVPVTDGGYALIGARRPQPALFNDMPWGTETVMAETRRRMTRLDLSWREPFVLWDVDVPADLERMRREGMGELLE
jgi:rSAM/selenodomain-associated transferase 1